MVFNLVMNLEIFNAPELAVALLAANISIIFHPLVAGDVSHEFAVEGENFVALKAEVSLGL